MGSKTTLFDDIFQLQNTLPEEIDPEDPEDGFKSGLTQGATEVEDLGSTQLKKRAALILDDPKYRGKRTSRKALYSDDDQSEASDSSIGDEEEEDEMKESETDEADVEDVDEGDDENDVSFSEDDEDDNDDADEDFEEENDESSEEQKDATILAPSDSNDREKGKAVSYQLGLWDDLIKCRISLQRMMSLCNRLPTPDVWKQFVSYPSFKKEVPEAQSSVQQILSCLLDLQEQIEEKLPSNSKLSQGDIEDEEITSESEAEDEKGEPKDLKASTVKEDNDVGEDDDDLNDDEEKQDEVDEDDMEVDKDDDEEEGKKKKNVSLIAKKLKRKLGSAEVEDTLCKRHKELKSFRNQTLSKWDEKTRLSHVTVKAKNFAAFDISVLKQIQQVLANKGRLIKRIHQNRSSVRVLGHAAPVDNQILQEVVVEDDEDELEVRQRDIKPDVDVNYEIVDDTDFYQMCLRDFIQLKQNEETDPVLANRHWLEIQNMRKKHKRKVDTRASKGRKIRYHVKEKLKNFMAPYDKSMWSDEQKDDLFKALFGGRHEADAEASNGWNNAADDREAPTINIGL